MKWDIKAFIIFMFTILLYGGSYFLSAGKFAFPLEFVDFAIAIMTFVFLLKTPFSQYSLLMIPFGFSFTYLAFGVTSMQGDNPTVFMVVRDITIFLFAVFLLVRVFRNKNLPFRGTFLFFGLLVLGQLIFNGINFTLANAPVADLIKSLLGLLLCLLVFRQVAQGDEIKIGVKRMFILVGMYCFRLVLSILTDGSLFS